MEIWKDIPGYEGHFQVSNRGRVRSLDRKIYRSNGRRHFRRGHIKSLSVKDNGYIQVGLTKNGNHKTGLVHQLVALAFLGEPLPGEEVNHKDGDKGNNLLENLEYVSHQENVLHSRYILERGVIKLNSRKAYRIRELYWVGGEETAEIAVLFGVSASAVRQVVLGRTWKYVPFPPVCTMFTRRRNGRKITWADAKSIRLQYKLGIYNMTQLAERYGVSLSTVSRVISGERHCDILPKAVAKGALQPGLFGNA